MTFDKDGRKTSEKIVTPPVPGYTVVTTLDCAAAGAGGEGARGESETRRDRDHRAEHRRHPRDGFVADVQPERVHPEYLGGEVQGAAGRS